MALSPSLMSDQSPRLPMKHEEAGGEITAYSRTDFPRNTSAPDSLSRQ